MLLPLLGPTPNIYYTDVHSLIAVAYIDFAHQSRLPEITMASTESTSNWRDIETRTKKSLAIETSPSPENISKCNQQQQSPLFGVLPAEIRNDIFALALLQYEDLTQPYPENDFCYRPGHRARRILSTELLLTCRRIWLEANHWPMEQAVHSFWFDYERRPSWTRRNAYNDDVRFTRFMDNFSSKSSLRIKHIQVSAQMYWFERNLEYSDIWGYLDGKSLNLDTFTVTIRHTDWWLWESDDPLRFDEDRIRALLRTPGASHIAEFRLELETLEWNMNQLRPILDKLRSLKIHNPDEDDGIHWELVEPFEEITWSGPTNIDGEDYDVYAKRDKLDYRIMTVKWRRRNPLVEATEQRWREEGSLLQLAEPEPPKSNEYRDNSRFSDEEDHDWDVEDDDEDDDEEDDDDDDDEDDGDDEEDDEDDA